MAKRPLRIADVLGFAAAPQRNLTQQYARTASQPMPRSSGAVKADKGTVSRRIAQAITPNTRLGNEYANKIASLLDMATITGSEEPAIQAGGALGRGDYGQAAGYGILAALGAVPGVGKAASKIDDVIRFAEDAGVKLYLSKRGGNVAVNLIEVPKEMRSTGIGSDIMNRLSSAADDEGLKLTLTPDASRGATSVGRLKDFYKRFGFVENKGRAKDFEISDAMYREPRM